MPDRSSAFPPQRSKTGLRARSGKRDRGLAHQPRRPQGKPGDPAARTNSPFTMGPADREGAKRDRARHGQRDADRNPSERVGRRRGARPGIDAPLDAAVFAPSPRDHPGCGRSAATPASNANESARGIYQSIARRSPLARRVSAGSDIQSIFFDMCRHRRGVSSVRSGCPRETFRRPTERLSVADLRLEWRRLFRADPPRLSRDIMMRAIAYRLQEIAHGGASKVTQRRLMTLTAWLELILFPRSS